ncbi:MAG: outer membrane protein assembly factor, partial [Vicinamibacterales bacterium]
ELSDAVLTQGLSLQPGQPFYPTQLAIDQDAVQLRYANAGFRNATVSVAPRLSADNTRADIVFTVEEGPQVLVDHILIVGNERTSSDTIRRELQFKSGDPLGLAAISESQRRLATLGLFRRTRLTELGHGAETSRDILVTVDEAPVTTLGYGGGLETKPVIRGSAAAGGIAAEQLEFAPRAFFEVGRRNLFGKNRSINLFTRVSFRPQNFSGRSPSTAGGGYGFSEYRVIGTYREPRVRGTAADAFLTGTLEQQRRASFNFARRAFTAELLRRLTRQVSVTGNYQLQRTELFDERIDPGDRLLIDRLFPQVRISSFSLSTIRDTRDDLIDPKSGSYLSANGQIAGRHIGSEVGFMKSYFTAQAFRLIPQLRQVVVATSVRVGMAAGFSRTASVIGPDGQIITETVRDLPASERFFAGGDTTVRGFALDQLGTVDTIGEGGFPIGGNGLLLLNAELRLPVRGGFGLVGFVDAGNVFARTTALDLGELRSAVGFGIRYKSPVGPIRVDFGFKANRRDLATGVREDPTAVHISLGQAF